MKLDDKFGVRTKIEEYLVDYATHEGLVGKGVWLGVGIKRWRETLQ